MKYSYDRIHTLSIMAHPVTKKLYLVFFVWNLFLYLRLKIISWGNDWGAYDNNEFIILY
jgi:hypothetical protein